jgi:trigger factor
MDEINQLIGSEIYKYVDDNKIEMLGQPLPNEAQEAQDLEKPGPYVFIFDIAVAPEINVELSARNKIDYYDIKVDDKLIEQQISAYASRFGHHDTTVTDYQDNDLLKGDLRELDEKGNTKEGGITVEGAIIMPSYIKVEDQKALFDKAKLGDIITFNPRKAYPNGDFELSSLLKIEDKEQAKNAQSFYFYSTKYL